MERWAKIENGRIVKRRTPSRPPKGVGKDGDGNPVWRPVVETPAPEYNPATHAAPQGQEVIYPNRVEVEWTAPRPLSEPEQAAQRARQIDQAEPTVLHLLLLELVNRDREAQNRAAGLEHRLAVLEGNTPPEVEPLKPLNMAELRAAYDVRLAQLAGG